MVINTNMSALSTARLLMESNNLLSKSLARLSSGSKIISPEDDPAGLAISMRFDAQINRITAVTSNLANAVSFNQTQDGFLKKVAKALDRMSELAIMAQDVMKSDADRALYNQEFVALGAYITDLATKEFNGVSLFDGTSRDVTTDSEGNTFNMAGVNLGLAVITTATGSSVGTIANAVTALANVKAAITQIASDRATIGANLSRLTMYSEQLGALKENLLAANSRIKDVDVAEESTEYARFNILVQTGTAMLAQANALPTVALRLLT